VNPAQALAQWLSGVSKGQSALDAARAKLDEHIANPCTSPDAAEHRQWLATKGELEIDVAAEEAALQIAETKAAEAKVAAEKAEADVEERRVRKLSDELAKLTVEIGGDAERLAAKLRRHTEMVATVEGWNKTRGARTYIPDGERRVREVPEQHIPAEFDEIDVWRDGAGREPMQFRERNGQLEPIELGFVKRRERVCRRTEQHIPAVIPGGRFADGFKLMGLKGEALFPGR
jgi:hypothetical protein